MWRYILEKSPPLTGDVEVSISKNSVLPLMAAALLTKEPLQLTHIPNLSDTAAMIKLLEALGAEAAMEKEGVVFTCNQGRPLETPQDIARQLRASFIVLGPLLARFGEAFVPLPGGCSIGARPVDLHLKALMQMGAVIEPAQGGLMCRGRLKGTAIYLDYPSVGCTENLMMAATLAQGRTTLHNAAQEPEIMDLAQMLSQMGASVWGAGTGTIQIEGCSRLRGTVYTPMRDRIEAGTYLYAAAITRGDIRVVGLLPAHLQPVTAKLKLAGARIDQGKTWVRVCLRERPAAVDIQTLPWPGFPTDLQSAALAAACTAGGTSLITETVFENRFLAVPELVRMGAQIRVQGSSAVVEGVDTLRGAQVEATDLRAGAALILAALAAEGTTTVLDAGHIRRGYENMSEKLRDLGANIQLLEEA